MKIFFVHLCLLLYTNIFYAHTIINTSNQTYLLTDHKHIIIILHPQDTYALHQTEQTTWHVYRSHNNKNFDLFCHLYILNYAQDTKLNLHDLVVTQHERIINSAFLVKYPKTNIEQNQDATSFDFTPTSTNNLLAAIMAQQEKNKESRPNSYSTQTYTGRALFEKIETITHKNKTVHPFAKSSRK